VSSLSKAMLASITLLVALTGPAACPSFAQNGPFDLDIGDPDHPDEPKQEPQPTCSETFTYHQPMPGAAVLSIDSPCRRDAAVIFNVEGHPFHTVFDSSGHAETIVPLFKAITHITWPDPSGAEQKADVTFEDYDRTVQIVLVWDDPVDLNLRLVEPKGLFSADEAGNVYAGQPNTDLSHGYGTLVRADDGQAEGTHAEIYVLSSDRNPVLKGTAKNGAIAQKVEFVTRDAARKTPYCDGGELAAPTFTIYSNVYGKARLPAKKKFGALACAAIPQNNDRLFGIDPTNLKPRS